MTGWRLGWAIGPKPVIAAMSAYQSHSTSNASSISQDAALEALTDEEKSTASVQAMLSEYALRRQLIVSSLNSIEGVRCPAPDGAFYAFCDVSALYPRAKVTGSVDFSKMLLERAGVATIPGAAFGEDRYIRFSFAAARHEIEKGMRLFQEFAGALRPSPTQMENEPPG
jgi:aspartate aminotransferase